MEIQRDLHSLRAVKPVVTIGIFDGVHRGHASILARLKETAGTLGGSSIVLTLWPHPRLVLDDRSDFRLLNTLQEKTGLLEEYQIDHLVILDFTWEVSRLTSGEFIRRVLVEGIGIRHLIVGFNHRFGKDREGDFRKLTQYARKFSFGIEQLPPFQLGNRQISSSLIRKLLLEGQIAQANSFLGYEYFLDGMVTAGSQLGRSLGFPTANVRLMVKDKLIPADGVYAVRVETDGKKMEGMMNIGIRPTVNDNRDHKTMEVHIFDFSADIYQSPIRISFIARMRDEMKFESTEALKSQLVADKEQAMTLIKNRLTL